MIKVEIKQGEEITNSGQFQSQEEAEAWVAYHGFIDPVYTDITAELEQAKINEEAQAYLDSTDWLIIRQLDNGEICPPEIKEARAEARARIVR